MSIAGDLAGKRPWGGLPQELHPKQRIFLSIDAIDSTKFKSTLAAAKGSTSDVWAKEFSVFLPEVVVVYWNKLVKAINTHCRSTCSRPCISESEVESRHSVNVWKYIGDEVVLMAELACEKHAFLHVLVLAETLNYFNRNFADERIPDDSKGLLRFKGTAWVAGFPVANIELCLPGSVAKDRTIKDFLGPSMDLGFRLSKFSSKDKLVISASLAFLIAKPAVEGSGTKKDPPPLCFGASVEIKGVRGGKHPLIWYPVNETAENRLCIVRHKELLDFLKNEVFKDMDILPFVPGGDNLDPKYDAMYEKAAKRQRNIDGSNFFYAEELKD